jgi:DNA invertase Pin-like site-specific DNA recombinase
MIIGYARVSSYEQNLDLQLDALHKAGCKRIFKDKLSGAKQDRPGLSEALQHVRQGDTMVTWKLDRLGRSVKGLIELVGKLREEGINFHSITDGIDTTSPAGRFFFHVMASLAQMERELLIERTRAGRSSEEERACRRQKAAYDFEQAGGGKKTVVRKYAAREVAQTLGISVPTLYRWWPASERV